MTEAENPSESEISAAQDCLARITNIFQSRVVGQDQLRTSLMAALMGNGHVLLESVPGLAKTTAAQALSSAVSGEFHRIQCTPDLMPNDIVGTQIFNSGTGEMTTQLGPVHANIVLLDEINRSSAKSQSAMLEAMQERQTTIGGVVYPLPEPFMVLATQNPIEEEGTYVLPEAQMDRFIMKEILTYPKPHEELDILTKLADGSFEKPATATPVTLQEVSDLRALCLRIFVHDTVKKYIIDIVNTSRGFGTRPISGITGQVRVGISPRGSIALMRIAQALAIMAGRSYVIPDDITRMRHAVLRHRLVLSYDALANRIAPEKIIDDIFNVVPVP